jgi:hypothetical protein
VSFVSSTLRLIVASYRLLRGHLVARRFASITMAKSFRPDVSIILCCSLVSAFVPLFACPLCRLVDIASTAATHLSSADCSVVSTDLSALVDYRVPRPSKPPPPFAPWCQCHHLAHSSSAECHRELYCAVLCPCHANSGYWLLVHQPSSMSPRAFHPALVPTPPSSGSPVL